MAYLLGADEAGYGPNLGPLVVSVTVWKTPDEAGEADLYQLLAGGVGKSPTDRRRGAVAIADSKLLYKPSCGLAGLELGLFAALAACGQKLRSWQSVWEYLHPGSLEAMAPHSPWFLEYDSPLPIDAQQEQLAEAEQSFAKALAGAGVSCLAIRSAAVFPTEFNRLTARHGSKGELLSQVTLSLVRDCLATIGDGEIFIGCDKHGGRSHYAGLLQHLFPDEIIQVARESGPESVYRWGPRKRRVQIRFSAKGESWFPSALASMASKYLRELAMRPFNEFWRRHSPGLKATAGYPTDARRFRDDIRAVQDRLQIPDDWLWRER